MNISKIRMGLGVLKGVAATKLNIFTPVFCQWEVTLRCNMDCPFCTITRIKSPWVPEMDTQQALKVVDQLAKMGVVILNITGGEPLLRDDLGIILKRAKKKGMFVIVACNGWYVKEKIELLDDADEIRISLDGIRDYHDKIRLKGSFARTMEAIDLLKARGKKITINSVIMKDMPLEQITGLCDFAVSKGIQISLSATNLCMQTTKDPKPGEVDKIMLACRAEDKWFNETIGKLRKKYGKTLVADPPAYYRMIKMGGLNKFGCQALRISFSLKPDGSIAMPCGEWSAESAKGDLIKIWKSNLVKRVRKKVGKYWFCKGCRLKCFSYPSMLVNPRALLELGLSYKIGKD